MTEAEPQFSIGIDLGTTHCVLAYSQLDDSDDNPTIRVLPIEQLIAPGVIDSKNQLPSFIYLPSQGELDEQTLKLPWPVEDTIPTGEIARQLGSKSPQRVIASAKSWLCHAGIDRHSACLPVNNLTDLERLSPVEVTYRYLANLKSMWNRTHPEHLLENQAITITIPASFDPVARELTAEAAEFVGFEHLKLLEEPQAALYNWIQSHQAQWRDQLNVDDHILVVDIGGGTTDLSLVKIVDQQGELGFERIAAGQHILLGGDNMDLALAYQVKAKMASQGKQLETWQIQAITQACGEAKEALLSGTKEKVSIAIPARGSKLLGSTLSTELTLDEVTTALIEGFFPITQIDEPPQTTRRSGISHQGLPYAQDPAITKHIAAFLTQHAQSTQAGNPFIQPTAILFNGGVLQAPLLQQRLIKVINNWLNEASANHVQVLEGNDLNLSVALGASYHGFVEKNEGIRIKAGLSQSYYVGIESAMPAIPGMPPPLEALCIAPFGMEANSSTALTEEQFQLIVGEPLYFQFFSATNRQQDHFGVLLPDEVSGQLDSLPDIRLTLEPQKYNKGDSVTVQIKAHLTDIGTLQFFAVEANQPNPESWRIELDIQHHANPSV